MAEQHPNISESRRSTTAFIVAWVAYSIVIILLRPSGDLVTHEDFRNFYSAGVLVRTDPTHLYDLTRQKVIQDTMVSPTEEPLRYVTPPFETLRYLLFCGLPYRSAYIWVMLCNLVFIVISFVVAKQAFVEGLNQWELGPELLFFLFVPLTVTITQGQGSILFLLLVCLSWREYERDRDFRAGFLLAFTLYKFTVSIPLAIFLIARRGTKLLAG